MSFLHLEQELDLVLGEERGLADFGRIYQGQALLNAFDLLVEKVIWTHFALLLLGEVQMSHEIFRLLLLLLLGARGRCQAIRPLHISELR